MDCRFTLDTAPRDHTGLTRLMMDTSMNGPVAKRYTSAGETPGQAVSGGTMAQGDSVESTRTAAGGMEID